MGKSNATRRRFEVGDLVDASGTPFVRRFSFKRTEFGLWPGGADVEFSRRVRFAGCRRECWQLISSCKDAPP